jgi:hypothetical protein
MRGRTSQARCAKLHAGVVLDLAALVGNNVAVTVLGATDPRESDLDSWTSDTILPLAYGFVTVAAAMLSSAYSHEYTTFVRRWH